MSKTSLICGVNWLGDSVMSLPAVRRLKDQGASVTLLVKPSRASFWRLTGCVDQVIELASGMSGAMAAADEIRGQAIQEAFILPNSFRAALIPFMAGVPVRVGVSGHYRSWMLNRIVSLSEDLRDKHQACETFAIMGLDLPEGGGSPESLCPELCISDSASAAAREILGDGTWIGMMPGAARGPSKQWPAEHFVEMGKQLVESEGCRVCVLGSPGERDLCARLADAIGDHALSLGGQTELEELAAVLGLCRAVVTNDSGGMHLAAAAGSRVVAVFGLTNPAKTGPLGKGHCILAAEGGHHRDIARDSEEASAALRSIKPEQVLEAVRGVMRDRAEGATSAG